MLFINEYRTFLASPIHFLLGLFMFIPPANMLTCTKTESNKLNQQFTLSEILQRMIYNLQYRPHEDPSWHLLPRNYNKNNVCGSGPQGPSPPPSLSIIHTKSHFPHCDDFLISSDVLQQTSGCKQYELPAMPPSDHTLTLQALLLRYSEIFLTRGHKRSILHSWGWRWSNVGIDSWIYSLKCVESSHMIWSWVRDELRIWWHDTWFNKNRK